MRPSVMQKIILNNGAMRTSLTLDADQVLEEIAASSIQFIDTYSARRGPTHKNVEAAYLKGTGRSDGGDGKSTC